MLEQHNILFTINQQNKFGIVNKTNRVHFISEKKENGGSGLTIHLFTHSHQTSTAQHLRPARHLSILPNRATSAFLRNTQLTSQDQLSCTLLENMWKISEHILFFCFLPEYIELSHCSSAEDDGKIIVCQNVWCTCGYCHGHFAFYHCSCHWVHLLCYVFEKFHWNWSACLLVSLFSDFRDVYFPCFLDTIYKVMFVLLCMRKQKNGCVLLAEGSLWEAVPPTLLTWYNNTFVILVPLKRYNQSVYYLHFLYRTSYDLKNDVISMSRAWDKEKVWVLDRNWTSDLPYTGRCSNHWVTKDSWRAGPYTRFMYDMSPVYS